MEMNRADPIVNSVRNSGQELMWSAVMAAEQNELPL